MIGTFTVSVAGTIDLDLTLANGYQIDALGPGTRTYRRETATSPFTRHRYLIDRQLDTSTATLQVWIVGSTAAELDSRTSALLAAFDQLSYTLQVTIDGVLSEWLCEPADASPGDDGMFNVWDLGAFQQSIRLSIPRDPLPLNGAL